VRYAAPPKDLVPQPAGEAVVSAAPVFPADALTLNGKKGLVVGIANEQSIAYGCARAFRFLGAELALSYYNDKARPHVEPLAKELEASIFEPLNVMAEGQLEALFEKIEARWGRLDFLLHSIAFAPRDDLHGRVVDCSREGFGQAMDVSVHSFIRMAHLAEPLMKNGGALFTMTFFGAQKVVENYNLMGPVKAALESTVRYLAAELGPKRIRVHAISPGPLKTRAASGLSAFDELLNKAADKAPTRALVGIDDVGIATAYLATDAAHLITGNTVFIDGGYNIID
jgi:enoyl-[acyl-carrier protein] reductase I